MKHFDKLIILLTIKRKIEKGNGNNKTAKEINQIILQIKSRLEWEWDEKNWNNYNWEKHR